MSDLNERLARALCFSEDGEECCASPEECWDWDADTDRAHRVIEALTAQGLAIVPVEQLEKIRDDARRLEGKLQKATAMLAAYDAGENTAATAPRSTQDDKSPPNVPE